ncbi:acylphosphatase [Corynebacterium hylobatis]|uniref:acylphosphatase n=1 Tax=Corynebacterium hylobatis TaxID=1859290 RepID=A0A3S0BGV0_9CORY|nr:acylphosphatase [Corynebacterium hylobatis]RSZ62077.1 acylphosphatase [Corynebacterium hylobatis]
MTQRRLVALVDGHVQGVGFRWWARGEAVGLGLAGSAENLADGRVRVVAEGPEDALAELLRRLPSGPGRVKDVAREWAEPVGEKGFDTF